MLLQSSTPQTAKHAVAFNEIHDTEEKISRSGITGSWSCHDLKHAQSELETSTGHCTDLPGYVGIW